MRRKIWFLTAAVAIWLAPAGRGDDSDEPGRGVARISVINGDVSVRRGDSGDWVAAAPNAPLVVQDHVLTGANSRAELQFDWANFIRLSSNTELRLSELEHLRYQIQVARGTVTFRVLRDSEAEVEVSTPAVSVRPRKKGSYRVAVRDDGETEVTVRSGEVEVFTPRGVELLKSGKTMVARSTTSDTEFQLVSEIPEDDFDRWNVRRDRELNRSNSYRYVHRDIYGAEDLDHHGAWVNVDTYGWAWRPHVHVGWAPYHHGRWAWVDWYGWTWVSYDPWGWAPYHYGRWFHHGHHGWLWYPGGLHRRHYWSPALVAFFGIGPVRVGLGFGRVGWVPLAPYEPYYRWYGRRYYGGFRSGRYIDNSVNIVNNVNVTNIYRNSRVRNAVSAVDGGDFARGRMRNVARVSNNDIRDVRLVRGQLPVTPERESTRFADREARIDARTIARGGSSDSRFYSRRQPVSVERVSFEEQRQGMKRLTRREPGVASRQPALAEERSRGAVSTVRTRPTETQASARSGDAISAERQGTGEGRDWRRFGEPSVRTESRSQGARTRREPVQGWRTFGEPASGRNGAAGAGEGAASRRDSTRGWRTTGEGSDNSAVPTPNAASGRTSRRDTSGTWQRFGEQRMESRDSSDLDRGAIRSQTERSSEWQRFSDMPSVRSEARSEAGAARSSRSSRDESSGAYRHDRSPGSQNSIRLSPPVIRQRSSSTERFQGSRESRRDSGVYRGGSYSGGGGVSMRSAPRSTSGGGSFGRSGGGARISGGRASGGGGRTSGGGASSGGGRASGGRSGRR